MIYCIVSFHEVQPQIVVLTRMYRRNVRTYVHGTAAVVLNNLVARLVRTTANNPGFLASLVSFLWI